MSLIAQFREAKQNLEKLKAQVKELEQDERLQKEIEFENELRDLMGQYGKSLVDILAILDPASRTGQAQSKAAPVKRARKVKQYRNPHNNEVIETKGGNHKVLKEWKAKWGADEVESWATILD